MPRRGGGTSGVVHAGQARRPQAARAVNRLRGKYREPRAGLSTIIPPPQRHNPLAPRSLAARARLKKRGATLAGRPPGSCLPKLRSGTETYLTIVAFWTLTSPPERVSTKYTPEDTLLPWSVVPSHTTEPAVSETAPFSRVFTSSPRTL